MLINDCVIKLMVVSWPLSPQLRTERPRNHHMAKLFLIHFLKNVPKLKITFSMFSSLEDNKQTNKQTDTFPINKTIWQKNMRIRYIMKMFFLFDSISIELPFHQEFLQNYCKILFALMFILPCMELHQNIMLNSQFIGISN